MGQKEGNAHPLYIETVAWFKEQKERGYNNIAEALQGHEVHEDGMVSVMAFLLHGYEVGVHQKGMDEDLAMAEMLSAALLLGAHLGRKNLL